MVLCICHGVTNLRGVAVLQSHAAAALPVTQPKQTARPADAEAETYQISPYRYPMFVDTDLCRQSACHCCSDMRIAVCTWFLLLPTRYCNQRDQNLNNLPNVAVLLSPGVFEFEIPV